MLDNLLRVRVQVVASGLLILAGCSGRAPGKPVSSQDVDAAPVKVMTVSVKQEASRKTSSQPATVHALHTADIRAQVTGYLKSVTAEIGDVVKEGAPLATIAVPTLDERQKLLAADVERLEAEEESAQAGIALADAGVSAAKARLEQSRAELQSVDAALAAAEAEFVRTTDLVDRQSLEPRMLDEVRKKRDSRVAQKAALTSAVLSAEAEVVVADAEVASARAVHKSALAATNVARRRLDEHVALVGFAGITSPFAGVVTARNAEPGNLVGADADEIPLFVISQIDRVRIHVSIPERDAAFVNPGDRVTMSFPSFGGESLTSEITRTSASLNPETRMLLVEVETENTDRRLLPGMFGQVEIELAVDREAAYLPARAIRFTESGEAYVYAVVDDRVSLKNVETGADDGKVIEIVSGIESGQRVIDAHLQRFTDGQQVLVLNQASASAD